MENELQKYFIGHEAMPEAEDIGKLFQNAKKFSDLLMMYHCAIREVRTKVEILNDDVALHNHR
ncbi:MAG: GTP pyrophosphokinase family protein, partial [Clostridia bacterium]|nr:GTP pyrophosphokinase family protein [Clostridia bacterium]